MSKISLGSYTLRVRRKWQSEGDEEWEQLGAIGENGADLLDFLRDFVQTLHRDHEEDEARQSLLTIEDVTITDRTAYGWVRSGPWGASAEIVNHRTRHLAHTMSPDEAALMPFFFLFHVPGVTSRGIMLLQRHGSRGIKTHMTKALTRSFGDWLGNYLLDFWQHVPGSVLRFLTEGLMREVELISYDVPADYAELDAALRNQTNEWDLRRGTVRTQVVAKRGERWPIPEMFRRVLTGERTFHEVREELGFEDERIRLTIDYHGTERTIDLADPQDISPYFDISEEVRLQGGHPVRGDVTRFVLEEFLPDLIEDVQGRYHE